MIKLRNWQQSAMKQIEQIDPANYLVVAPTGGGKTYLACHMLNAIPKRTLVVVHRLALLQQWADSLQAFGIEYTIYHSTYGSKKAPKPDVGVVLSMAQTLGGRGTADALAADGWVPKRILCDEAHRAASETYLRLYDSFEHAQRIGLSATPLRAEDFEASTKLRGTSSLKPIFDTLITTSTTQELIDDGSLVAPEVITCSMVRESMQRLLSSEKRADYRESMLDKVADEAGRDAFQCLSLFEQFVSTHSAYKSNPRTLIFASTQRHARQIHAEFIEAGHTKTAFVVSGEGTTKTRQQVLNQFDLGEVEVLISVAILFEGFDSKLAHYAIMARPTRNPVIALQSFGRVLRSAEGKGEAVIIDAANVCLSTVMPTETPPYKDIFEGNAKMIRYNADNTRSASSKSSKVIGELRAHCSVNPLHGEYQAKLMQDIESGDRFLSACPCCRLQTKASGLYNDLWKRRDRIKDFTTQRTRVDAARSELISMDMESISCAVDHLRDRDEQELLESLCELLQIKPEDVPTLGEDWSDGKTDRKRSDVWNRVGAYGRAYSNLGDYFSALIKKEQFIREITPDADDFYAVPSQMLDVVENYRAEADLIQRQVEELKAQIKLGNSNVQR